MIQKIILLFFMTSMAAYGFEFEGGHIRVPDGFEGPVVENINQHSKVYGFKYTHEDGLTGALLQLTVFDSGHEIPSFSPEKMKKVTRHFLTQFLSGVEKRRSQFETSDIEFVLISGVPASRVTWRGIENGRQLEGIMYAYVYQSKVISLHTQDFIEYDQIYIQRAKSAFESIVFKEGADTSVN